MGLLALLALGLSCQSVCAATTVIVRNDGPAAVQIGFDGAAPMTVAPRATTRLTLNDGEHSAQCRFEGAYDGCNLEERFTIAGARQLSLNLRPVLTLEHAVALARQGMVKVETRRDVVWATNTPDVPGTADDCANYGAGKLGAVSQIVRSGILLSNPTMTPQNLCGERRMAVSAMIGGAQLYFHPRFLLFRDSVGRPVLVR